MSQLLYSAKRFNAVNDTLEVHAFPYKTYKHPEYGELVFNRERAERMKWNFDQNVLGQKVAIDYQHKEDPTKGTKAAGWVEGVDARDDGLWLIIKPTPGARKEIEDGEWAYLSVEYADTFKHPETGMEFADVVVGGGLTNYPFLKGVSPINMSELKVTDEVAEKEHSEPGSGGGGEPEPRERESEPVPFSDTHPLRNDPDRSIYDSAEEDMEKEIREALGLDEDADILEAVKKLQASEAQPDPELEKAKKFSELFPEEARRMASLVEQQSEFQAKQFADAHARKGSVGFSPVVLEKVRSMHRAFSNRGIPTEDLHELLDQILDNGLVPYGERGSSVSPLDVDLEPVDAAKKFGDIMRTYQFGENLSAEQAFDKAIHEHADLYRAYRSGVPTRNGN